ncbi:MAG: element excision factor XisI family protein [Planctomycetaceae bacterium]
MASTRKYDLIVKGIFDELAEIIERQSTPRRDGAETICVRNHEGANFLLVRYGWRDGHRVRAVSLLVRVRDGKVRIEEDMTDWGVVDRLIGQGVDPEHIILAFQRGEPTAAERMTAR